MQWRIYAATLTDKARERANSIFDGLKQRFPDDDISELAACPENLRTFGAPDGTPWEEIKSPHGLMEVAWPQLRDFFRLKLVAKRTADAAAKVKSEQQERLARARDEENAALAEEARRMRSAFEIAFPTEECRLEALERFKPGWVSNAATEPGRSFAIDAWFHGAKNS